MAAVVENEPFGRLDIEEAKKGTSLITRFPRPSRFPHRVLERKPFGDPANPTLLPKRPSAIHARSNLPDLPLIHRIVQQRHPIPRPIHRPLRQLQHRVPMQPIVRPAPSPSRHIRHRRRPHRIRLHISAQGQKMPVFLHRKTFEPSLIKMSPAPALIMLMMATNMRHTHPPHPFAQRLVCRRPHHHVPMVVHETIGQQFNWISIEPLRQHGLECKKIAVFVKEIHPPIAAVEHMIDQTSFDRPCGSRHIAANLPEERLEINKSVMSPFSLLPFLASGSVCQKGVRDDAKRRRGGRGVGTHLI
jgi:hypothetical protein